MTDGADWTPPANPNPSDILHEGVDDACARRYEIALAKFVWFYENVLAYEPDQSAVRLSFGLGYWYDLAEKYPPALAALQEARDRAERNFKESRYAFEHFHELAALNRVLGDGLRTANAFKNLSNIDVEAALRVYHVAEQFLIDAGEFSACGPFLDPVRRLEINSEGYRLAQQFEDSHDHGLGFARTHFVEDAANLVALLALNGRTSEAEAARDAALQTLDDVQFRAMLDAALSGHLPKRRFS